MTLDGLYILATALMTIGGKGFWKADGRKGIVRCAREVLYSQ
jgi:hypothetical protein